MASSPLGREYLPSPSAKTPPANAVHAFFTPRRPLGTIGFNSPSRTHLLSPDESPSRRCKRARLESSPFAPRNRDALVGTEERPQPEPVSIPQPRKRIRPNTTSRVLMRELDAFGGRGMRYRGNHCSDWRGEVDRFYSRPEDICSIIPDEEPPSLPFSTQACNRSTLVAVGDEAGKVRLIESGKDEEPGFREPYLTLDCHDNAIFDMSWSADDRLLATSSGDQSCRIFDVASQTWLNIFRGHTNSIKTISFNPFNPSLLASTSRDGLCNIWDLRISGRKHTEAAATTTLLDPIRTMEAGATADSSVTAALWIAEHRIATTCQSDAVIRVWDLKTAFSRRRKYKPIATSSLPPAHELPNHRKFALTSLCISPDYQRIYALCKDNNIYTYATNHLQNGPMHAYSHPRLHASTFYVKADISRDGRLLASGSGDGVVTVFPTNERYLDPTSYGNFMHEKDAAGLKVGRGAALVRGHEKEVTDVSWTVDGDLVSISDDYHVRCWRQGERGVEAEEMRGGGEAGGRRWGWGWAEVEGEEGTEETVDVVAEDQSVPEEEESNAAIPN